MFAENAKSSFATGKLLAGMDQRPWSIKVQQEPDTLTYFWDDKSYLSIQPPGRSMCTIV